MLYRVRIGEDEYLGSADEVVAFLVRTEGAPGTDPDSYMAGVARRLRETMGVEGIDASSAAQFLETLADSGVVPIETLPEPSEDRIPPEDVLGEGPVAYGPGVDPDDVPSS